MVHLNPSRLTDPLPDGRVEGDLEVGGSGGKSKKATEDVGSKCFFQEGHCKRRKKRAKRTKHTVDVHALRMSVKKQGRRRKLQLYTKIGTCSKPVIPKITTGTRPLAHWAPLARIFWPAGTLMPSFCLGRLTLQLERTKGYKSSTVSRHEFFLWAQSRGRCLMVFGGMHSHELTFIHG